jgi:phosphoglycerate dehydrogenase-like enzyme
MPVVVVEDDRVLRLLEVVFEPWLEPARSAALADYFGHDGVDLVRWRESLRQRMPALFPVRLQFVSGRDELRAALPDADAVVVEKLAIGKAELAAGRSLAVICKFGTITDNIDLAACRRRQVPVHAVRRRTNVSVAEHVMMLVLALARRLPWTGRHLTEEGMAAAGRPFRPYDRKHVANNNYARVGGVRNLAGLTLGSLGMGEIGREVAAKARAFGMRVIYHQRHRLSRADEQVLGVSYRALDRLLAESDVVTVHVPLGATTRGMIGRRELALIKPGGVLINTSRAEIVDRDALNAAVADDMLQVGLDVHYEEPMRSGDALLGRDNVILTPHVGGGPRGNPVGDIEEIVTRISEGLRRQRRRPAAKPRKKEGR